MDPIGIDLVDAVILGIDGVATRTCSWRRFLLSRQSSQ